MTQKRIFSLGVICLVFVLFSGCQKKTEDSEESQGARKVENTSGYTIPAAGELASPNPVKPLLVPLPTESELKTLGQEIAANQKYLKYLPDNPVSFVTASPDRAVKSAYFAQFGDVAGNIVVDFLRRFQLAIPTDEQIPFQKILRVTSCVKPPKQPAPRNPQTGMPMYQSPEQVPLTVNILELKEPVNDLAILAAFNQFGVASESLTPTLQGSIKFYDLIPVTEQSPILARVAIVDPNTAVFAIGTFAEISQIFDSESAKGAIPSRILHTNLEEQDFLLFYSSEGVAAGATVMYDPFAMIYSFTAQNQPQLTQEQFEKDAAQFAKQVKCITIALDLQSKNAAKLLSLTLAASAPSDVPPLKEVLQSSLTSVKTLANFNAEQLNSAKPEDVAETAGLQKERVLFATKLLDAISVSESGTQIQVSLTKTAELEKPLAEQLSAAFTSVRQQTWAESDKDALRGIAAGLSRYIETHEKHLPDYAISDANGQALLSWRVAILPALGEEELYKQFHLNEAWDSEHNKTLLDKMPKVFADPKGQAAANKTVFRMIGGTGSFIDSHKGGFSISDVKNPSDTMYLIAVNPEQAAEWTKPEFVQYDAATFKSTVRDIFAAFFCSGDAVILPTDEFIATDQFRYWVAGEVSPQVAAMRQQQMEQQQLYQQYLQQAQQAEKEHQQQLQQQQPPNAEPLQQLPPAPMPDNLQTPAAVAPGN